MGECQCGLKGKCNPRGEAACACVRGRGWYSVEHHFDCQEHNQELPPVYQVHGRYTTCSVLPRTLVAAATNRGQIDPAHVYQKKLLTKWAAKAQHLWRHKGSRDTVLCVVRSLPSQNIRFGRKWARVHYNKGDACVVFPQ